MWGKTVGNWGDEATVFRFDAVKDGKVVQSVTKSAVGRLSLDVRADHTELTEGDTYDVAALRIRVCDEYGNVLPFFHTPLKLSLSGPLELIGPAYAEIAGGMGGAYVRTTGETGEGELTVSLPAEYESEGGSVKVRFRVVKK